MLTPARSGMPFMLILGENFPTPASPAVDHKINPLPNEKQQVVFTDGNGDISIGKP